MVDAIGIYVSILQRREGHILQSTSSPPPHTHTLDHIHMCTHKLLTHTHTCTLTHTHKHTHTHHHTVWSVGHHGPTDILVEKLNPMLVKYKVAAYFSGHDHDMQHINDSNVQYFLSGAGHLVEPSQKHMVSKHIYRSSYVYDHY